MATSARKHTVPAALETPRRAAINDLAASINDIVPVANVTARAQLLADLAAMTPPYVPSASRPLVIARADAPAGAEFEYTVGELDGSSNTVWRNFAGETTSNITSFGTGWGATNTQEHRPRVRRQGNQVVLFGSVSRSGTSGASSNILTLPPAFQPPSAGTRFVGSTTIQAGSGGTSGTLQLILVGGVLQIVSNYGSGSIGSGAVIPLVGATWWMD